VRHAPAVVISASVGIALLLAALAIRRFRRAQAAEALLSSSAGAETIE